MDEKSLIEAIGMLMDEKLDKIVEESLTPIQQRLELLEAEIRSIKITQENNIYPKIRALYEGYSGQREISIETRQSLHILEYRVEMLKDDVSALKMRA